MAKDSVRDALRKINEVLYNYDDLSVDVAMRGGKITITADLGQSGTRTYSARMPAADGDEAPRRRGRKPGRPAKAKRTRGESGKLPTADELHAAISSGKNMTMTKLAKVLSVKPRQRLAPVLLGLVRAGSVRKAGLAYVTSVPGGEKKRGPGRPPGSGKKRAATKTAAKRGRKPGPKTAAKKTAGTKKAGARKVGRPAKKAPVAKRGAKRTGRGPGRPKKDAVTTAPQAPAPATNGGENKES